MTDPSPTTTPAPSERRPFQFRLRTLLALPVGVAVFAAGVHWLGVGWVVLLTWGSAISIAWYTSHRTAAVVLGVSLLAVFSVFFPAVSSCPEAARRATCTNNLKQIALALHAYEAAHGCLPPPYLADSSGRPMHSWRVLILPFMDEQALYKSYRLDEPWDGPNNRNLGSLCPRCYRCPNDVPKTEDSEPVTSYLAVIGPKTAWPGDKIVKYGDITDGTANTLLVAEVAASGIHWMEPRDLHVLQMAPGINRAGQGIASGHKGGANAVMVDGSVHFIPDDLTPAEVDALLTIAGGEPRPQ